jgi:hypothetical protein
MYGSLLFDAPPETWNGSGNEALVSNRGQLKSSAKSDQSQQYA